MNCRGIAVSVGIWRSGLSGSRDRISRPSLLVASSEFCSLVRFVMASELVLLDLLLLAYSIML